MNKERNSNADAGAMVRSLAYIECLIYCFYPSLSIILITIGSIFKKTIDYYAEYTQENLNVVCAILIFAGCFAILLLSLRIKMNKAKHMYVMCFVVFPTLLVFQIIALIYGCVQAADRRSYLLKAFQRDMGSIFTDSYYRDKEDETRFNILQNEFRKMNKERNSNADAGAMVRSLAYIECLIYCFYPSLSIILITIGSIFKKTIDYYAEYTQENLNVVCAILIFAGCFAILLLSLRIKMNKAKHMYVMCFVVFPTLLVFQIIALIYGCVQAADRRSYLLKAFQRDMGSIFTDSYYRDKEDETRFNILQNELECCGVFNRFDYKKQEDLPVSCCPAENLSKNCTNATYAYDVGCASRVYDEVTFNIGLMSYITIGLVVLQILVGSFFGYRILKHFREKNQNNF